MDCDVLHVVMFFFRFLISHQLLGTPAHWPHQVFCFLFGPVLFFFQLTSKLTYCTGHWPHLIFSFCFHDFCQVLYRLTHSTCTTLLTCHTRIQIQKKFFILCCHQFLLVSISHFVTPTLRGSSMHTNNLLFATFSFRSCTICAITLKMAHSLGSWQKYVNQGVVQQKFLLTLLQLALL